MFLGFARPKSAKPLLFLFPKLDLFPEVLGLPAFFCHERNYRG